MKINYLARKLTEIAKIVRDSADPTAGWLNFSQSADELVDDNLKNPELRHEILEMAAKLSAIWATEPPLPNISFLYFGIFEAVDNKNGVVPNLYVSGGTGADPEEKLNSGNLSYLPKARFLDPSLLRLLASSRPLNSKKAEAFDYLVVFGASAILVKFALKACSITLPVFVGFDSGDFARVD